MKRLALEYWLPVLLWLFTIYSFSTDTFSSRETSRIIVPILTFLFPGMSLGQIDFWHEVIRKLGHITEYSILAALVYRSLKREALNFTQPKAWSMIFIILAALVDEYHQTFVPSRGPSLIDVGYDSFGGLLSLWLIALYETRHLRSHPLL